MRERDFSLQSIGCVDQQLKMNPGGYKMHGWKQKHPRESQKENKERNKEAQSRDGMWNFIAQGRDADYQRLWIWLPPSYNTERIPYGHSVHAGKLTAGHISRMDGRKRRAWKQSTHGSPYEDNDLHPQFQGMLCLFCTGSQYRQMVWCQREVRQRSQLTPSSNAEKAKVSLWAEPGFTPMSRQMGN